MECAIPLSVLSKLGKYGIKQYKPYNDAKKLLPEKYQLNVVEEPEVGKAIKIENEEDFLRFFTYFVEELLGRGEAVGQRITYEGVPLEKYESAMEKIADLEREKAVCEEKKYTLQGQINALEKELAHAKKLLESDQLELLRKENRKLKEQIQQLKLKAKVKEIDEKIEQLNIAEQEKNKLLSAIHKVLQQVTRFEGEEDETS